MNWISSKVSTLWKKLTKKIDEDKPNKQLREFIYLDDTSILSLLASIEGSVIESVSTSQSKIRSKTVSRSITPSIATGGFETNSQEGYTSETNLRMNIQAQFVKLTESLKQQNQWISLQTNHPFSIERPIKGKIIEVTVSIRPLPEYTVGRVMSELYDSVKSSGPDTAREMLDGNFVLGHSLITRMQANLIPVILTVQNGQYSASETQHAFNIAPSCPKPEHPLRFVSYIKKDNCWQDPVLFLYNENISYHALIRFQDENIITSWNGFPLYAAFNALGPILADFNTSITNAINIFTDVDHKSSDIHKSILAFYINKICDPAKLSKEQTQYLYSIESDNLIEAFNQIDDYIDFHSLLEVNRNNLDEIKKHILDDFEIDPLSNQPAGAHTSDTDSISSIPESFRGEIIAIYW